MRLYIDLDSGSVLHGPIYAVEVPETDLDAVLDSDSTAREYAIDNGTRL